MAAGPPTAYFASSRPPTSESQQPHLEMSHQSHHHYRHDSLTIKTLMDKNNYGSRKQQHRFSCVRTMSADAVADTRPWLSRLRSALRLLIIVLSASVAGTLIHTLEVKRGNNSLDLRNGELPMTWPARTNLWPTFILFSIAVFNFLASVAIMGMAFKRSFRRPLRSRDAYRIVAGSFGVILWATGLVVFNLLDKNSKASLGSYACRNRNVMSNGRYQYRAVCSEQVRKVTPQRCGRVEKGGRVLMKNTGPRILPRNGRSMRRSRHAPDTRYHGYTVCKTTPDNTTRRREIQRALSRTIINSRRSHRLAVHFFHASSRLLYDHCFI